MLCENCQKREANVNYLENINGVKKEYHLCEECSRKLGITSQMEKAMNFSMPLDFPSFFGSLLEDFSSPAFMPYLNEVKNTQCNSCGSSFDDIVNTGRFGCPNCYETFEDKMDPILKRLQGANRHVGRLGKISDNQIKQTKPKEKAEEPKSEKEKLEEQLKQAIQEERYEEAAKIRDEMKKLEK